MIRSHRWPWSSITNMGKMIVAIFLLPILGLALWTWATLTYVYAYGERAGYVQKFSKKGWIFKTWEGELAMVNLPGAMPEIFHFTVRNDRTAADIQQAVGRRVTLHYEQHKGIPGRVFGDTSHFVTKVTAVGGGLMTPPPTSTSQTTPSTAGVTPTPVPAATGTSQPR
jgi:hypothetical protein